MSSNGQIEVNFVPEISLPSYLKRAKGRRVLVEDDVESGLVLIDFLNNEYG